MRNYTRKDILRLVEEEDVGFIRLQFTDIYGTLKNVAITTGQLERALNNECMFDGSSIEGFSRIEESDMYLRPDLNTFTIFPWRPQQGKVARFICDIYRPDGTAYESDPRQVLENVIRETEEMGYQFVVGPEFEFFLFHQDDDGTPTTTTHEKAGYFDLGPLDLGENARRDMVLTLEDMGIEIEASHHEMAPAQHEIDLKYEEALETADNMVTFRMVVKTIAKRHGLHATFMPKPKYGINGSGMHLNMSLSRDGENIFSDENDEHGLSQEAYYFIGGLMKHIKAITFITNPLVNSYKRLVPGYEAPTYIAWSANNRTPLIRIPESRRSGKRIELRSPDASANPYLALAVCLAAGMEGIREKILPPKEISQNIFELNEEEKKALGIECLPGSLMEAVEEFEKDAFIQKVLGEELSQKFIKAKKAEYDRYRSQVSEWEMNEYLQKY
ncbi:type I glutamate--ammonia ligase [bacterium]|uniref:type I glutamate--ammonia ligase n=1 Tax=Lachnospiraceae TaxID=186803 RepID=UPI002A28328B|nr:type I glutamate--ammonia ligase [bacterium]MDY2885718.1 type I glutamate--ammonia ligase [Bariatricus sp.]MCI7149183.1 type I glutamate--ammonia ligase [bacterium]MDD6514861.1 type I glutamate--ammonia ligase [bacterium]MDD7142411.1 type I glutamate--ammonia ligase [bacterium]